jgi:hypothetical protein
MVNSRPPLAGLVWLAFYVSGVARCSAALHPGLLFLWRLRRKKVNGIGRDAGAPRIEFLMRDLSLFRPDSFRVIHPAYIEFFLWFTRSHASGLQSSSHGILEILK